MDVGLRLYDRMDTSPDPIYITIEENPAEVAFTTEACLQREIAYVITTLVMTLLKKTEIAYPHELQGRVMPNCLPSRFVADLMGAQFTSRVYEGNGAGEYLGQILVVDRAGISWERRKIYFFENTPPSYFCLCFASKVVTKEYMFPSENLVHKIEQLKEQIPVVEQIWAHFHVLVKELSAQIFKDEDWKEIKKFLKGQPSRSLCINSGNPPFALNHVMLQKYVMALAKEEIDFISCFRRVCEEWDGFKRNWSNEEVQGMRHLRELKEILLKNE